MDKDTRHAIARTLLTAADVLSGMAKKKAVKHDFSKGHWADQADEMLEEVIFRETERASADLDPASVIDNMGQEARQTLREIVTGRHRITRFNRDAKTIASFVAAQESALADFMRHLGTLDDEAFVVEEPKSEDFITADKVVEMVSGKWSRYIGEAKWGREEEEDRDLLEDFLTYENDIQSEVWLSRIEGRLPSGKLSKDIVKDLLAMTTPEQQAEVSRRFASRQRGFDRVVMTWPHKGDPMTAFYETNMVVTISLNLTLIRKDLGI